MVEYWNIGLGRIGEMNNKSGGALCLKFFNPSFHHSSIPVRIEDALSPRDSIEHLGDGNLRGFCVGWRSPPGPEVLLEVLRKSDYCIGGG